MNQPQTIHRKADPSLDVLTRLKPNKLIFHWKAASLYTTFLGLSVVLLYLAFSHTPATFTPDPLQANVRLSCLPPLLAFCFVAITIQRLAPSGMMPSVVLLATTLSLWITTAAASLSYGLTDARGMGWLMTTLMVFTTLSILLLGLSAALFSHRARQHEQANTDRDALTGLLTRNGFLRQYAQLTPGQPCTLVVIDLNQLKAINDTSGHGAGDIYIRSVAQALQTELSAIGTIGRWGGDEFAAIIPLLPEQQVVKTIDALLRTTPTASGGLPTFAYGTATLTAGEPLERAFALADQRMYERKELQRTTRTQHARDINAVGEVSRELELLQTSEDLLTSGLPLVASLLRFDATFYVQRQTATWIITTIHAQTGTKLPASLAVGMAIPLSGVLGRALREKRILWSTDYPTDPDATRTWVEAGLKTVCVTPVRCLGEIVGFCCLANFGTWRSITPQIRRVAETTSLRLGHVLDLERVERNVRLAEQEVRATIEGGLLGLGAALEARDFETGGHTRRVVEYASHLGHALGLPPEQLLALQQGAYLHDIGKLVIPDRILLKPGKLTPEEWAIMKTHSCRGGDIAKSIPTLTSGAVDVIHHHHERWDGAGYPDGLTGEEIPLVARIFSVCDVYDALTSARPYKEAWSRQEAKAEIERQAGKQFDPNVVQAFLPLVGS